MTFLINAFYYNEPAWYEATTTDYKTFDLRLYAFNAPYTSIPPRELFLWQSEGKWCCNVQVVQEFVDRLGSACEEGLKHHI